MTGNVKFDQKKRKAPPAQALVEVAIVLPMLLLLVLGALDFGRMFFTKIVLTNAAREGANYLSRIPTDKANAYTGTISAIQNEATSSGINATMLTIPTPLECCITGLRVGVTVSITGIPLIFGGFYQ